MKGFYYFLYRTIYKHPQLFRKFKKINRGIAHPLQKNGPSNWNKQRIKVTKIYEHITNARTDY